MHINFNEPCKVHFIGIGGVSMSSLASILHINGFTVTGSDISLSESVKKLQESGIRVAVGHDASNLDDDTNLIVYTVAVRGENPEIKKGRELGIKIVDRATMLGAIMENYKENISVAGTHGKTTTSSMISEIYFAAKKDPTVLIGAKLPSIDSNYKIGSHDYIVCESCEYYDSFLKFFPTVSIILNIEEDHLDYFKNLENIHKSFVNFSNNTKDGGVLIINDNLKKIKGLTKGKNFLTFSLKNKKADYFANNIIFNEFGFPSFDVYEKSKLLGNFSLSVTGMHNVENALSAIACARFHGLDTEDIKKGLMAFKGAKRRFEYKGFLNGFAIVDDYAHHPSEIEATIKAARNCTKGKLVVLFQPHTYSRTISFLEEFGKALSRADEVLLMDIYSANREKDEHIVHSKDLQTQVRKYNHACYYFEKKDELKKYILNSISQNDMLITMGAGNVYLIGDELLNK